MTRKFSFFSVLMFIALFGATIAFGQNYEIQSRLANGNFYTNEMQLQFRIYNKSNDILDLKDKKLTYYFTDESPLSKFLYNVWWYSKGQQNDVNVDFYETNGNNKSFAISFLNGVVEVNGYAEIQMRVYKSDWSYFSQIDDISVPLGTEWTVNSNTILTVIVDEQEPPVIPNPQFPFDPQEEINNNTPPFAYEDILQDVSDFAVFGLDGIWLADRTGGYLSGVEIYGSVGTNEKIEFGADSKTHGNSYAKKSAFLRERASLYGNLRVGENYSTQNNVLISGNVTTESPAPLLNLPTKDISAGAKDITINPDGALNLESGTYRNLTVYSRSTLKLKSGVYSFNNFKLEPEATLEIDVSGGTVEIRAVNSVAFSDRVKLKWTNNYVNPIALQIYQNGSSDFILGRDVTFAGRILAPNAKIRISSGVKFAGWLQGKSIQIEPDTKICEPPTLESFSHSGVAFAPYFSSLQAEYYSVMLPSEPQISVYAKPKNKNVSASMEESASENAQLFSIKLHSAEKESIMQWCAENIYSFTVSKQEDAIIYAKGNSSCSNDCDGSSWGKAYKDLSKAISAAKEQGKSIYLAEGTYKTTDGHSFVLNAGTDIRGGFDGVEEETLETRKGDINSIILDGENQAPRVVEFFGGSGFPYSQRLDRVTVARGKTGVFALNSSPILDYLIVRDNNADNSGGGIFAALADTLKISNSYIVENSAKLGGGIFATENTNISLINTIIANNAAENGSAIYAEKSDVGIRYATIANNNASGGKGTFLNSATASSVNSIVWNNGESDIEQSAFDPLFSSIIPAGEDSLFYTKDDGYALSDSSQMIDKGVPQEDITTDIFMVERSISKDESGLPDMGAREWFPDLGNSFTLLRKSASAKWKEAVKPIVLSESVDEYFPLKLWNSSYTYNLSVKVPKNKHMKSKHYANLRILDENKKACGNKKKFAFYRIAEENGIVEYRTYKDGETYRDGVGRFLFLSQKEMPSHDWYHVLKVCEGIKYRFELDILE